MILIILAVIVLVLRCGALGGAVVGAVWLAAAAFNPNVDSGTVWLLAFVAAYIIGDGSD